MPRLTLLGHPVHALTSDFPVAFLSATPVFDGLYLATRKPGFATTAKSLQTAGLISGLLVGLAGWADYTTIPNEDRELKKNGNMHALINITVLGLSAASLALRSKASAKGEGNEISAGAVALSSISALALVASAWYGGEMIYELGMRVKGVDPVANSPELKIPFLEKLRAPLSALAEVVAPRPQPLEEISSENPPWDAHP